MNRTPNYFESEPFEFEVEPFEFEGEAEWEWTGFQAEGQDPEWEAEVARRRRGRGRSSRRAQARRPGVMGLGRRTSKRYPGQPYPPRPGRPSRPRPFPLRPLPFPAFTVIHDRPVGEPTEGDRRPPREPAREPANGASGSSPGPQDVSQEPSAGGSEYVRWVQSSLNQILGINLPLDGVLGVETRSAVRSFQEKQGLPVDGVVDPDTERALQAARSGLKSSGGNRQSDAAPPSPIEGAPTEGAPGQEEEGFFDFETFGMERTHEAWEGEVSRSSRDYIRWVQQALNRILGLRLTVDGIIGAQTRSAVRAFQERYGLTVDGIVGSQTERALIAAGAGQPSQTTTSTPAGGTNVSVNTSLPQSGPGFSSYVSSGRRYGQVQTIQALQAIGRTWQQEHPNGPRIGIGDISFPGGGEMPPHKSHQTGLDVDIRPMRSDGREGPVRYQDTAYSRVLTQELVDRIINNGILRVQYIFFNDPGIRSVRHWPAHDNHLHVRFYPPSGSSSNLELGRVWKHFGAEPANQTWEAEVNRSSRDYIRWLQQSLNRILGLQLAVDGIVGQQTRSAVRRFQQRAGLKVDGSVGPKTEAALIAAGASSPLNVSPRPTPPLPSGVDQVCPEPTRLARDRCLRPGAQSCPAIPDLLCLRSIDSVPFEYPNWRRIQKDSKTNLYVVQDRQRNRLQRFVPSVRDALRSFTRNMQRFGMPIEAIITGGSLYCRCITNSNTLSNHSFGDAIDIVGLRWSAVGGPAGRVPETIVHNYRDASERARLRRINACLRLSFATVIDYHQHGHRDHFHCDMNRGRGRSTKGRTTVSYLQEALNVVLGRNLSEDGKMGRDTLQALSDFSGRGLAELKNEAVLNQVYDDLFTRLARG